MVRTSVQSRLPRIYGRRSAAIRDGIVLDRMFQQAEDPHPAMAAAMVSIYRFLTDTAPGRGNWTEGLRKASKALKAPS